MQKEIHKYTGILLTLLLLTGITSSFEVKAQEPGWHSFEKALSLADNTDRPILVDIWAPWCGWCHKMKQEVYPALASDLSNQFVITRLNRDDHEETHRYQGEKFTAFKIAQKLNAESVPTIVFLTPSGNYLLHLSGFRKAKELRPVLEYIATESYRHQTFQTFIKQKE